MEHTPTTWLHHGEKKSAPITVTCPHCGEDFQPSNKAPDKQPPLVLREISAQCAKEIRKGLNTRSLK
jgi:hypothetical protein